LLKLITTATIPAIEKESAHTKHVLDKMKDQDTFMLSYVFSMKEKESEILTED
jgi:hypothetical protein